jgi:hypothetical protein
MAVVVIKHSMPFVELLNICRTAREHGIACSNPSCPVSMWTLGLTAERLFALLTDEAEQNEALIQMNATRFI